MRPPMDFDEIERWEAVARTPKAHRGAAAALVAAAEDPNQDDEVTPADLLSAAAWHLRQAGDPGAGIELLHRAVTAEGTTTPDVRCMLAAALLETGRTDEARQVAEDLRRSGPRIIDVASMAESFELVGDLSQAHRWAEMGATRLDLTAEPESIDEMDVIVLLNTRRRVRQALSFPPDDLDELLS